MFINFVWNLVFCCNTATRYAFTAFSKLEPLVNYQTIHGLSLMNEIEKANLKCESSDFHPIAPIN